MVILILKQKLLELNSVNENKFLYKLEEGEV